MEVKIVETEFVLTIPKSVRVLQHKVSYTFVTMNSKFKLLTDKDYIRK